MAACLWFHLHMLVLFSVLRGGVKQTPRLVKIDQACIPHLFLSLSVSVCVCALGAISATWLQSTRHGQPCVKRGGN